MADFLVLDDFAAANLPAGAILSDTEHNVDELAAAGAALLAYNPATMAEAVLRFGSLPFPRRTGALVGLLAAAGAIGGGGPGTGDVVGPASATDNTVARYNGPTGKVIQGSAVGITDTGSITLPALQTVDGRDVSVDGTKLDTIATGADVTNAASVDAAGAVMESDFSSAQTVLVRGSGPAPAPLVIPASRLLGRTAVGDVDALTAAQIRAILGYPAAEVSYDNAVSGLTATQVQAAIDELAASSGGGPPRPYEVGGIGAFVTDAATPANRRGYTLGAGSPLASLSFTLIVIARPGTSQFNPAPRFVAGTCLRSGGSFTGGYGIIWDQGWRLVYVDNAGVPHVTSQFDVQTVNKFVVLHLRVSNFGLGVDLGAALLADGAGVGDFYDATGGGTPTAGGNFCVGAPNDGASAPADLAAFDGFIQGVGYVDGTAMNDTQIAQHVIACQEAGQLVDPSGLPLTDGWRASSGVPGVSWASFKGGSPLSALASTAVPVAQKPYPIVWY